MVVQKIEITPRTLLTTIFYLLGLWFIYQIRGIIILLFMAFILMTAVGPLVRAAAKIKLPPMVVFFVLFLALIGMLTTLVVSLVPAIVAETAGLIQNLPKFLASLSDRWSIVLSPSIFTSQFGDVPTNLLKIAAGTFGNIVTIFALFFMTYYLYIERKNLPHFLHYFVAQKDNEKRIEEVVAEIEKRVGDWVRGELLLMIIIGVMSFVGLTLLGIPYTLPLAILAGLMEAVPSIGPVLSSIPAILLGLTISPLMGLGALAMSILIQQTENNLIVPKVMQRATGVRPIITILVLLVGYTLGGVIGAILAIPVYVSAETIYLAMHK